MVNVKRECGTCSLCCKLMEIEEITKPSNSWCPACSPGKGCRLHPDHPTSCKNYSCNWLLGHLPEEWFPKHAHLIVDFTNLIPDGIFLRITVDPNHPEQWRKPPYYPYIKSMAKQGLVSGKWRTVVSIGKDWTLVLPDKEVPHVPGTLLRYKSGKFDFVPFSSDVVLNRTGAI